MCTHLETLGFLFSSTLLWTAVITYKEYTVHVNTVELDS